MSRYTVRGRTAEGELWEFTTGDRERAEQMIADMATNLSNVELVDSEHPPTPSPVAYPAMPTPPASAPPQAPPRGRAIALIAAVAAILLLAIGLYFLSRWSSHADQARPTGDNGLRFGNAANTAAPAAPAGVPVPSTTSSAADTTLSRFVVGAWSFDEACAGWIRFAADGQMLSMNLAPTGRWEQRGDSIFYTSRDYPGETIRAVRDGDLLLIMRRPGEDGPPGTRYRCRPDPAPKNVYPH
jgi:hypothetical protein